MSKSKLTLLIVGLLLGINPTFAKGGKKPVLATMKTNQGVIELKLFADESPKTVENFVGLSKGTKEWKQRDKNTGTFVAVKDKPLYSGTIFHRVIDGFMIQGGDPDGNGMGGPGYKFEDETKGSKLSFNKEGILAMANSGPNTNGSQFFITLGPTAWLNGKHTIFGEVTKGMDVVKKIGKVEKDSQDRPRTPVVIESITIH